LNVQEDINLVQELDPKPGQQQARFHLSRTLLRGDKSIFKSKAVVAQQATTKRSKITVPQQYRWHMIYESSLDELRRRNTGVFHLRGNNFGKLIHFFITSGDKTNLSTSEYSRFVKAIGDVGIKTHEKKTADYRSSISLYRTCCVTGETRRTIFLMKGNNGCTLHITIVLTWQYET
jgi:hypothetical protein